jgi:arylsulfatase A
MAISGANNIARPLVALGVRDFELARFANFGDHVLCYYALAIAASFFAISLISEHAVAAAIAHPRPNIVIILADDLGYGDVACYNPTHGKIATPNLDRFASEGMRFTDAHSSSAVCSPSRYSLLTGRYHWRTWLQSGIVSKFGPPLIAPERATIADLLQRIGYGTACFGKWHMGWNWPIPPER